MRRERERRKRERSQMRISTDRWRSRSVVSETPRDRMYRTVHDDGEERKKKKKKSERGEEREKERPESGGKGRNGDDADAGWTSQWLPAWISSSCGGFVSPSILRDWLIVWIWFGHSGILTILIHHSGRERKERGIRFLGISHADPSTPFSLPKLNKSQQSKKKKEKKEINPRQETSTCHMHCAIKGWSQPVLPSDFSLPPQPLLSPPCFPWLFP